MQLPKPRSRRANTKVTTEKPVELLDKSYRWEFDADLSKAVNSVFGNLTGAGRPMPCLMLSASEIFDPVTANRRSFVTPVTSRRPCGCNDK